MSATITLSTILHKRRVAIDNQSSAGTLPEAKRKCKHRHTSCGTINRFIGLNAPLTMVFQCLQLFHLIAQVSHCSKQFYRVSKDPNSWRRSSILLGSDYLMPDRLIGVIEHFGCIPHLNSLVFHARNTSWEHCTAFINNLKFLSNLKSLNLANTIVNPCAFALNLKFMPHLKKLNLDSCKLFNSGCSFLARALVYVPELNELNLSGNWIDREGCIVLAEHLKSVSHLNSLELRFNCIQDTACLVLCSTFKYLGELKCVDLALNSITNTGCQALAENLKFVPRLTRLNLSGNKIENCSTLAENLKCVPLLEQLDLADNSLDDAGCVVLAEHLKFVPLLKSLNLQRIVGVLTTWFNAVVANLKLVSGLHSLNLSHNKIDDDSCRLLAANLILVPELHRLHLGVNRITERGCRALVDNLRIGSKSLCELHMEFNNFTSMGCRILRQAVCFIPTLRIRCCRRCGSH